MISGEKCKIKALRSKLKKPRWRKNSFQPKRTFKQRKGLKKGMYGSIVYHKKWVVKK